MARSADEIRGLTWFGRATAIMVIMLLVALAIKATEGRAIVAMGKPPIVVWGIKILTPMLSPGMPFVVTYHYSKRAECYPPRGRAETQLRLWFHDGFKFTHYVLIETLTNRAPPAEDGVRTIEVPVPEVQPGHYAVQFQSAFICEGSARTQQIDGPLMEFDVLR